ncbi:MAG: flotillin-like FloA family protein [Bacteroidales bacterium]|nr:flotillin-like FloA family protein [Bacteroidales bacterium]
MKKYLLYIVIIITMLLAQSCDIGPEPGQVYEDEHTTSLELEDSLIDTDEESGVSFWDGFLILVITIGLAGLIVWFFIAMVPIKLWFNAKLSKVHVSWLLLIKMRWQNIPQAKIINLMVTAYNAGLKTLSLPELMKYYLAKVDLDVVVATMIRAMAANVKDIKFDDMAQLYLRKVDVGAIVHAQINAMNAQIKTSIPELSEFYLAGGNVGDLIKAKNIADNAGDDIKAELDLGRLKKHYLAGGNLKKTIEAYISAKKAKLTGFEFEDICKIDLAGMDVVEAIKPAINPIVVETDGVRGIARDGVELTMKVKVTLRSQIKNIIGGVSADTVLARVNESLATQIGLAQSHTEILQNPYLVADKVETADVISKNSAYDVLSVDVSDIKIGNDVSASLKVARAKAQVEAAKAELILAEEKVQKAMASAFLDGNISVQEYTDIKNKQADTLMRQSLANVDVTGHHLSHQTTLADDTPHVQDADAEILPDNDGKNS